MASGGKGYYAAQAASSSVSGGDPAQEWDPAESLRQVAEQRVAQWREAEGLQDDNDFAYAYIDFDQVVGVAGHHVADAWLTTRAMVEEGLLAAGARVVEGNPKGSAFIRPVRKHTLKKKPKTINVDKNVSEAVSKRIKGLTSLFLGMGAFKPAGILTDSLKAEWKQTCTRIAEKKVQDSEKATLDRVVNTWIELRSFLEGRGRPAPPDVVDLDQFLQHTNAPSRALQALKWINKNADQNMELSNLQVPTTPRVTGQRGQAPVVEPVMIKILEDRIVELHAVGNERWTVLLACWIMAFGCLRYTHITRSEPSVLLKPSSTVAALRASRSTTGTASTMWSLHASPMVSFGPKKSLRLIGRWLQLDNVQLDCVFPMRDAHGPSWRFKRACKTRWPLLSTTSKTQRRTPGAE